MHTIYVVLLRATEHCIPSGYSYWVVYFE